MDQQTIRRDLETLKLLGFPLEETEGPRGRTVWRSPQNDGYPPLQFTFDEAIDFPCAAFPANRYTREGKS